MKRLLFVSLLFLGCADDVDDVDVADGVLISVTPSPTNSLVVSCSVRDDGYTCDCTMSECGKEALEAAGRECNRLRQEMGE